MNHLSILIYLIGTLSSLHTFFMILCGLTCASVGFFTLLFFAGANHRTTDEEWRLLKKWVIRGVSFSVLFGFIGVLVPNERTLILIAASEFTDTILHNEKIVSVTDPSLDLLKTWIISETHSLKKEMENNSKKDN